MQKVLPFLREFFTPLILLALTGVVIYDHYLKPDKPAAVVETRDKVLVQLGKEYKAKWTAALHAQFDAISQGSFDDIDQLINAQRDATDKALEEAYIPIAAELENRYKKAEDPSNKTSINTVKNFFENVAYGLK